MKAEGCPEYSDNVLLHCVGIGDAYRAVALAHTFTDGHSAGAEVKIENVRTRLANPATLHLHRVGVRSHEAEKSKAI